jgi:hypothetical protein
VIARKRDEPYGICVAPIPVHRKSASLTEHPRLLDQVFERDLDLALLSGLYSSEHFRAFMLWSAANWNGGHRLIRARVSEMTDAGETDILMVVDLEGAEHFSLCRQSGTASVDRKGLGMVDGTDT